MIGQLNILLRIKKLKEERSFRAVNIKRHEVAEALSTVEGARETAKESKATLPAREDAIYHPIIGHTVQYDAIEEAKGKMQVLEKEHTKLVDDVERAVHVHARLEEQLAEAVRAHRKTVIDRDKYVVLNEEAEAENSGKAAYREETEFEDIFSVRHRRFL
jgi:hypothetical protein